MLEIRLLGQFKVQYADRLIEIPSRTAQSLLAYLALNPGVPHRREKLSGLLWPDATEANARSYLRMALWRLHKSFEAACAEWQDFIQTDDISITFQAGSQYWLDADRILERRNQEAWSAEELTLRVSAYAGELLPGFYEEWIVPERERLRGCFEQKMFLLIEKLLDVRNWNEVLNWAERWISFGYVPEPAYRALMLAHAMKDDLPGVSLVHKRCLESLENQLGTTPSPEFEELYSLLKQGKYPSDTLASIKSGIRKVFDLPPVPGNPPYKGLEFFDVGDADLFFGREEQTSALLSKLHQNNFLAVVGTSGCGKSSLLRAGLVPALTKNGGSSDNSGSKNAGMKWLIRVITPTARPLDALAKGLNLQQELPQHTHNLPSLTKDMMQRAGASKILLVIDQFEELFTQCPDEAARKTFVDHLLEMADPENSDFMVLVIALRADFYAHCASYPDLAKLLAKRQEYISPMSSEGIRQAIEEPAKRGGWSFEPGLVDLFLRDAKEEPGALPLLSHALLETWRRRSGQMLTLRGYAETGGVHGAIARTAQRVFYQQLSPSQQRLARQIFLRLTELGEGTQDTRRRVTMSELIPEPADAAAVQEILEILVEARLITVSPEAVEVSHEALIREWPALRQWLAEDREGLRLHRHLTEAAQEWEAMERDEGELYSGTRLAQAAEWAANYTGYLNLLERGFLEASLALENRRSAEREAQQQRELEAARKLAELERSRAEIQALAATRLRRRAYQLSGFMAAVIILAIVAFFAWQQAVHEASVHHSLALAADAQQANQAGRMDLALALALEAVKQKDPPPEAVRAIRQIAAGPGTRAVLVGHTMTVVSATFGPDQTTALSGSCSKMDSQGDCQTGEIILWDLATASQKTRWLLHDDWVTSIALSQDGHTAISASADGSIIRWDLATGVPLWEITGHSGRVNSLAVNSTGSVILSGSEDGKLILWDMESGAYLRRFESENLPVTSVVFAPGDQFAIAATGAGKITLWDVESGRAIRDLSGHLLRVNDLAVSPDGSKTLSTSEDLSLKLWDNQTGEAIHEENINCRPNKIAISQDGAFALVSCEHMFYRWDIQKWREQQRFIGHTDMINALAISRDGRRGLSASSDGTLRLWNLGTQIEQESFESGVGSLNAIAVTPGGEEILLGSETPALWNIAGGQIVRKYQGFDGYVAPGAVDISPDGRILVIGGGLWPPLDVRSLVAWDMKSGEIECSFAGHKTMLRSVAVSPDNRSLLAGSQNPEGRYGDLILWDLQTCEMVRRFETSSDVSSIAFNPDGRRAITGTGYFSRITLWDVSMGKEINHFELPEPGPILDLAFSPDGRSVLGAGLDRLTLWDIQSGEITRIYSGHAGMPWSLEISPDGKHILSGSQLGEVILWDYSTGEELYHSTSHISPVYSVAFSPDGRFAYSASEDGQIIQWRITEQSLDELLDWINANRFVRQLTCDERREYRVEPICEH